MEKGKTASKETAVDKAAAATNVVVVEKNLPVKSKIRESAEMVESAEAIANALLMAEGLDDFDGEIEVTSEYLDDMVDGEEYRFIYAGMGEIANQYKRNPEDSDKVKVVKLITKDKEFKITAAAVLVGSCSEFPVGCAIKVVPTGYEKGKNGEYQTMKVFRLYNKR